MSYRCSSRLIGNLKDYSLTYFEKKFVVSAPVERFAIEDVRCKN